MNLLFVLINAKRPVSREQIRVLVPGYPESQAAFERMFERDKEQLRAVGVAIKTQPTDVLFEDSLGYLIEMPQVANEIELSLEEVVLIRLAEQAWRDPDLASLAKTTALTLESAQRTPVLEGDASSQPPLAMMNERLGSKVVPVIEAISTRRALAFNYQKMTDEVPSLRKVEPWRVFFANNTWYLIGYDTQSKAPRTYRLSRITNLPKVSDEQSQMALPTAGELDLITKDALVAGREAVISVHSDAPIEVSTFFRTVMTEIYESSEGFEGKVSYWDANEYASFLLRFAGSISVASPPELAQALTTLSAAFVSRLLKQ